LPAHADRVLVPPSPGGAATPTPWTRAAAALGGAIMAAPLWVGSYLPLLDLPQHLAIATVLVRHADPAWGLAAYFEPEPGELTPYWTHYLALAALGRFLPMETAARVFLTLYVLALPWAAIALARALGRPAALGLLALPLAMNANLYYGFMAYCWSTVILLYGVALLARQMDAPARGRALALVLLAGVLFFTHVQSFAFLLLAAAILPLLGGRPVAQALRGWPVLPATLGLFLPWLYLSTTARPGADRYFPALDRARPTYASLWDRLAGIPGNIAGSFQDRTDTWLLLAWVWVIAAVATERGPDAGPRDAGSREGRRRAAALLLAALVCYFALPLSIQGQWNIAQRFAWLAALLLPLVLAAAPRWLPAAVVSLCAVTAANAAWHHHLFDRESADFDAVLEVVPPNSRVLGLVHDTRGRVMERWPYLHFEWYAVVRGGGVAAHSFTANSPMPVRLRRTARVPAPEVWRPATFDYDQHGGFFDYFLVRGTREQAWALTLRSDAVAEVRRAGAWRVYRRRFELGPGPLLQPPAPPGR
jgi:hypothetical protein